VVFDERIASGVPDLDDMLSGGGFYRGSSVLITGVAGAGKSSLACMMADASCRRGERALYLSFEESEAQTVRNMKSVGTDIGKWLDQGQLKYVAARPTFYSLEMHLAIILREVARFKPQLVVLDPISAFTGTADIVEVQAMLLRVVDHLKSHGITAVFTHLAHIQQAETDAGLSSLMDAWILLLNREANGEFNRELYLLKARGIAHSNQVREFVMSSNGIHLLEPYLGEAGALTGSARRVEEARARRAEADREAEVARLQDQIAQRRRRALAQIETLKSDLDSDEAELKRVIAADDIYRKQRQADTDAIARGRGIAGSSRNPK
jgi:circadian clock protein KaiC